jgi:hypothetical protein
MELDCLIKGALGAKNPNHMAAANLMGLKLKVFGLVRERVEIASVDLTGALARAEQRVLNITSGTAGPALLTDPALGGAYRGPGVATDPFAE